MDIIHVIKVDDRFLISMNNVELFVEEDEEFLNDSEHRCCLRVGIGNFYDLDAGKKVKIKELF